MDKLFLFDVRELTDISFQTSLLLLSKSNQEKVLSYKQKEDQFLCLGARLLERKFIKNKIEILDDGKPITKNTHFNISHSYPYVVMYVNNKKEVGVDIEKEKELSDSFISNCFNEFELQAKSPIELWTLKEAYLKMMGTGINKKIKDISIKYIDENKLTINSNVFYKTLKYDNYVISILTRAKITADTVSKITLEKIF